MICPKIASGDVLQMHAGLLLIVQKLIIDDGRAKERIVGKGAGRKILRRLLIRGSRLARIRGRLRDPGLLLKGHAAPEKRCDSQIPFGIIVVDLAELVCAGLPGIRAGTAFLKPGKLSLGPFVIGRIGRQSP